MDYSSDTAKPPYSHVQAALKCIFIMRNIECNNKKNSGEHVSANPSFPYVFFSLSLSLSQFEMPVHARNTCIHAQTHLLGLTRELVHFLLHTDIYTDTCDQVFRKPRQRREQSVPTLLDTTSFSCYVSWFTVTMSLVRGKSAHPCGSLCLCQCKYVWGVSLLLCVCGILYLLISA